MMLIVDTSADWMCMLIKLWIRATERSALVEPQQVSSSEHRTNRSNHHQRAEQRFAQSKVRVVGREDRREFTPEPGQAGKTKRGHRCKAKNPTESRHLDEHSRKSRNLEGVIAMLHRTSNEEEHASDKTVGNHAEQGCIDAKVSEG